MATGSNTLGKHERLKSRKLISELFSKGQSVSAPPVRLLYLIHPLPDSQSPAGGAEGSVAAGFSASSRNFKKATDRNRIKRLLRESYRTQKQPLAKIAVALRVQLSVFFIYAGKALPEHGLLKEKTAAAMELLIKKLSAANK